jgi:uncharacterized membrane protein
MTWLDFVLVQSVFVFVWFTLTAVIVLVCTGAAVVVAKSSANKIPPTISCQPVEEAGTLTWWGGAR